MRVQMHAWKRGLKTGLYYLRTQAPAYPLPYGVARKSGVDPLASISPDASATTYTEMVRQEGCETCSA